LEQADEETKEKDKQQAGREKGGMEVVVAVDREAAKTNIVRLATKWDSDGGYY